MKFLRNVTAGNPGKLIAPIFYSMLSDLINILPFVLVLQAVKIIFQAFAAPEKALDTNALWWICLVMFTYTIISFLGGIPAYRSCYRGAYAMAADGRTKLAEHLRKLPLGYLSDAIPETLPIC